MARSNPRWPMEAVAEPGYSLFPFAVRIFICFPKRKWKKENTRKKEQFGRLHDRWKRPKMWKCISHDFPSKQLADSIAQPLHQWQFLKACAVAQPLSCWSYVFPRHGHSLRVTGRAKLWAGSAQRGTPKAMGCRGARRDMALMAAGQYHSPSPALEGLEWHWLLVTKGSDGRSSFTFPAKP